MSFTPPFPREEFVQRCARAQKAMSAHGIDALFLTSEPDVRYFSGFLTRFWESPTRPWYLILPARGDPVAVIPEIGAALMRATWVQDIRTWDSPDYEDDGITLLAEALAEYLPKGGRLGLPMGRETSLRMPLGDWMRLTESLHVHEAVDASSLLRSVQEVKSEAEIVLIRKACAIGGRAFARVPDIVRPGVTLSRVFRDFQALLLEEGADWVSYLAGGAAPGGYGDVISPAADRLLTNGDLLMLDTGAVIQGYFCDFDRNWSIGPATPEVAEAHRILFDVTEAAFEAARPGATASDLHAAMSPILDAHSHAPVGGRLGHGLGMRLTETPSLIPEDGTPLVAGMVLTLEPAITLGPVRMMVHEENILIREDGAEWLSPRVSRELQELAWPT